MVSIKMTFCFVELENLTQTFNKTNLHSKIFRKTAWNITSGGSTSKFLVVEPQGIMN
jgi:hypothetical protein